MEIKICGLTTQKEAKYLNEAGVSYAGFVFYEKSKRSVTIAQAKEVAAFLHPSIKKVAVTVSPDTALVEEIQKAGFDILQVHKTLSIEVLEAAEIPIWYACNITDARQTLAVEMFLRSLPESLKAKITGIVLDGAEYGSGKPFDWQKSSLLKKGEGQSRAELFFNRKFILAGGLNQENVQEGIAMFAPDVVDVSSGVEGASGKDRELILHFAEQVKKINQCNFREKIEREEKS